MAFFHPALWWGNSLVRPLWMVEAMSPAVYRTEAQQLGRKSLSVRELSDQRPSSVSNGGVAPRMGIRKSTNLLIRPNKVLLSSIAKTCDYKQLPAQQKCFH